MDQNTTGCVVHSKPAEARHGLLCEAHFTRLSTMLRDVEDEAAILSAVPSLAIRTGSGGGSLASTRTPARLNVLVHTDRRRGTGKSETEDDALAAGQTLPILDVLSSWARIVREECPTLRRRERGLDPGPDWLTVTRERDVLTRNLEWVAEQPWCDEMYTDIRQLLSQLRAANGTQPEKPVGRCYLPNDTGLCDGPIWVDDAAGHAHCGRCRQTWDGAQLAMLSFELERAKAEASRPKTENGRRMLTAEELVAQGYVSSVSNVRVKAHRAGIVSVDGHYDPEAFGERMTA